MFTSFHLIVFYPIAIMRTISLAKGAIVPLVPTILPLLTEKLRVVSKVSLLLVN